MPPMEEIENDRNGIMNHDTARTCSELLLVHESNLKSSPVPYKLATKRLRVGLGFYFYLKLKFTKSAARPGGH